MTEEAVTRQMLPGLRPEPLASYLAGLGLIRLIGEQADAAATAIWTDDGLAITTSVPDIASWLVDEYVPTPILSPWNNGSGFGPNDKEQARRLSDLACHPSPRLAHFPSAIAAASETADAYRSKGWDKGRAVQEFRNRCPDAVLPWIDAAVVLTGKDTFFPPLLGTGGNDGRLDFSSNFHQRVLDVLDITAKGRLRSLASARDLLAAAETERLASAAVGQFDPGAAGGPSSSRFGAADSLVNPWAYVLLVEGALLFAASAVRRHEHGGGRAAIPFTVYSSPDGSASGSDGEESRGEIWAPIWKRAFTLAEVRQLFGEARASWRGRPARRAVDFYAATRTLGVARGVDQFVRYGLHRRNGLAFAAVPVDKVDVRANPDVGLIASVEDWPGGFRSSDAPSAIRQAVRQFDEAQMAYAREGGASALIRMLAAVTSLERAVSRSSRARANSPVSRPPRAQAFLRILAREPSPELRVAVGLASCATQPGPYGSRTLARTMRQIVLPIDPPDAGTQLRTAGRWRDTALVAGFGVRPLADVMADVLAWRSRAAAEESGQQEFRGVPTFRNGVPVPVADLHAFARGELNQEALDLLLRACLALDWRGVQWSWQVHDRAFPTTVLALLHPLALGLAPRVAESGARKTALRPDWAHRLAAGQVHMVHQEVCARYRECGWDAVPPLPDVANDVEHGALLAAALVPRCRAKDAEALLRTLAVPLRAEAEGEQQLGAVLSLSGPAPEAVLPAIGVVPK